MGKQIAKTSYYILFVMVSLLSVMPPSFGNPEGKISVKGRITDADNQLPVPNARVFINGTTFVTSSDESGNFSMQVPVFPGFLIVQSKHHVIKTVLYSQQNNNLVIGLEKPKPTLYKLEHENSRKRQKNLKYFYSHFLSEQDKEVEILNDSVLYFISNNKEFKAFSKELLIVVNKQLGYKIHLTLKSFYIRKTIGLNGTVTTLNDKSGLEEIIATNYLFYENLGNIDQDTKEAIEVNRRMRYFGSQIHFLKSIYNGNPEEEGFSMLAYPLNSKYTGFKKVSKGLSQNTSSFAKALMVQGDSILISYDHNDNYISQYFNDGIFPRYKNKLKLYPLGGFFELYPNGAFNKRGFVFKESSASYFTGLLSLPSNYQPYGNGN